MARVNIFRNMKRGCVVVVFVCFVALFRHMLGAFQTFHLQTSFGGDKTSRLIAYEKCLSIVPTKGLPRSNKSWTTQQNKVQVNWLTRTHWKPKIDHHQYHYLVNPKKKCDIGDPADSSRNLTLLVLVKSAPGHFELRDMIRKTYIQGALKYNVPCRTLFLLGYPGYNKSKQAEIIEEAESHKDIIQEDFTDSYFNLTTKVVMGFKWAILCCKNSHFVMLTDDDVMFDIVTLVDDLSKASPEYHSNFVLGELTHGAAPVRNPQGRLRKFYTPKSLYPLDKYPTYPQGYGYIMSNDVVQRVFSASLELSPPVPWEDVYFGALLNKTKIPITNRVPWYKERHPVKKTQSDPLAPQNDYFKIELSIAEMQRVWIAIENELLNKEPDSWLNHTHWESKPDDHTYQYLIKPEKKCEVYNGLADSSRNLTLLVLVKSAPGHFELRDMIRKTYIQGALKYNVSCRTFFLLGYPGYNKSKQAEIIKEAESHGDIIQEDFTDSYFNLTTKVIMGVKWAITFCKNSRFVLFTDDDLMIDIVTLVNDLSELPESSNFVLGQLTRGAAPIRNPKNKWYIPSWLYKPDKYPEYPQRHGYIMSQDIGPRLFRASLELPPPVPWEDVYFGTLLDKIKVSITDRKPWYKQRHHAEEKTGKTNSQAPKDDYFRIELSVEMMHAIWNAIEGELTKNET